MARSTISYACTECGAVRSKWSGQCDSCGNWNTIEQQVTTGNRGPATAAGMTQTASRRIVDLQPLCGTPDAIGRSGFGIAELDRVLGGGVVPASAILVGGDPGIGKSTLLLQAAASLADREQSTVYVSGEEAAAQIQMRAKRLGLMSSPVQLATETDLRAILDTLDTKRPDIAIIDSIQTMWLDSIESPPGSVSQLRGTAHELIHFAKRTGVVVILVGHVTKDGQIAGPRVIEHMVDTVLYFEGDRGHQFRILRAVKNRFGPADEIGVFEMTGLGLQEVPNPSALFLSDREAAAPGSAVFAGIEGTRPLLVEIQALVADSPLGSPRRTVVGWDSGRLAMILAVLDARCGLSFAGQDVYLNVAGGLRISDPAADMAVAAALLSAKKGIPLETSTVVFGELSLSGALRPVAQADPRLRESRKLGFSDAWVPLRAGIRENSGMRIREVLELGEFVDKILASRQPGGRQPDAVPGG